MAPPTSCGETARSLLDSTLLSGYTRDMTTTTDFAPVLLNGEPIETLATQSERVYVSIDDRLYVAQDVASEFCWCRRCTLHDDFGGCVPFDAMYGLMEVMAGLS